MITKKNSEDVDQKAYPFARLLRPSPETHSLSILCQS